MSIEENREDRVLQKKNNFEFTKDVQRKLVLGVLVGIACFVWAFLSSPERAWTNYLLNSFYFVSLALAGGVFVAIHNIVKASWITSVKKISEGLLSFLPVGLLLMMGLFFGIHTIYEWSHHAVVESDPLLMAKAPYLNTPFFMLRMFVYFCFWIFVSKLMLKASDRFSKNGGEKESVKLLKWSVIFLISFAYTYCFASFDWLMSLRPHWFSTIFGVYNFAGMFVNGIAVVTFIAIFLSKRGYLGDALTEDHLHDLGKYLFGFSTFWAYIWISQYLLIWYSNIPEETTYFLARESNTWDWLFYFNLVINWAVPFIVLMFRHTKRSTFVLYRVAILLMIGRWLDLYLMVSPDVFEHSGNHNPQIGLIEVGMAIGFASLFALVISRTFKKKELVAYDDPYYEEGRHLHQ